MNRSQIIGVFFLIFSFTSFGASSKTCVVTRGVFDIGSGSTKMKVFEWNECEEKLIKELKDCDDHKKVPYKEDLKNSENIKNATINTGVEKLLELKLKAASCGATEFSGAATSAFRQAKNGEQATRFLSEKTGINIQIVSQEMEAQLGVIGAKLKAKVNKDKICVWDIGGSSMQITCESEKGTKLFLGHLASVPFKNEILKIQKSSKFSPNPIGHEVFKLSEIKLKEEGSDIKLILGDQMKNNRIIGIGGVHYYAVSKSVGEKTFNRKSLKKWILKNISKNDQQLGGGDFVDTLVSNVILVYGLMKELEINEVTAAKVNLADGVLATKSFW